MKVELLGGPTGDLGSPRLWKTDHATYAAQGLKTDDPRQVAIPHTLLAYVEPGTCLSGLTDTGDGWFLLGGEPITDPEALARMNIPGHEIAVEVPIGREVTPNAPARP
ncbi:hypothetical protein HLB23_35100 [Nocardia uniformis]|uniref:Uncharacterized protein n=2 Tax=Nocardia uniformis TaxID=53432 RepID=A0A849CEE9_9NOCA|nr:hypothetical protein [Nocardia uniformis]